VKVKFRDETVDGPNNFLQATKRIFMNNYRTPFPCLAILFLGLLLAGCSSGYSPDDLADGDWKRNGDREYVTTWSMDGVPLLEVTLQYHGKQPDLPFDGPQPSYDWKSRNTDFYACTLRNLTDLPIELRSLHFDLDLGTWKKKNPQDSTYLAKRWGTTRIPPNGSLNRRNTWIWGKADKNMLRKTFGAEIVAGEVPSSSPELNSLIKGKGGLPLSFSFQAHIRFIR
jgi:hypothetical protein